MSGEDTQTVLLLLKEMRDDARDFRKETNTHFKELTERTATSERRLDVIEDRQDREPREAKISGAKWGAAIGTALSGVVSWFINKWGTP